MSTVNLDSPHGADRLTKGLDMHGGQQITVRWHRVMGNCEISVNINLPDYQTAVPLTEWLNLEPLISHFVEAVAYGPKPKEDGFVDADWREASLLHNEGQPLIEAGGE